MILFFNLIPMYPLDGGQMLQAILWKPLGYVRSMRIACYTGMVVSVLMALVALRFGTFFLIFIAAFSFIGCIQSLRVLKFTAAEEETASPEEIESRNGYRILDGQSLRNAFQQGESYVHRQ